ncbi:related to monooxigenase [Phialocephala subalpina]|uniref:Related to monooxigenase n=1 Tax=Phialocephala subalpina TaxID=576137 RepID=A0A1L7WLH3_9HELO|nr:related to monooxigenase [Phialocephala subalpina]
MPRKLRILMSTMLQLEWRITNSRSLRRIPDLEGLGSRTDIQAKKVGADWPPESCACDVPAHTYQFAWEPNTRWSKFYAPAPEICEYLNRVVDKHGFRKYMRFNHRVVHAEWKEESSIWRVELQTTNDAGHLTTVIRECDVLVRDVGALNAWKYPEVEGLLNFKGVLMHTAAWDDSVDLTGKSVAVIGNGASAVHCGENVKLHAYGFVDAATPVFRRRDTQEQMERFENDPEYYFEYRRKLEINLASGFEALWRGTAAQDQIRDTTINHMRKAIKDEKMLRALIPDFEVGCRRFTPGDHYLNALQQDNCDMISDHIVRVTETGITDVTGKTRDVDVIICATGFDTSYEPRFPVIGKDGFSLAENWGMDKPTESYMGAMVARFPNFFVFNPPICPVIGSAFPGIASTSHYIVRLLDRLQHDALKSINVKDSAQARFNEWAQHRMKEMAFSGNCKSWYKNTKGKVFIPWPGTISHFVATTEFIRWEDFEYVWEQGNKYASLGNVVTKLGLVPI